MENVQEAHVFVVDDEPLIRMAMQRALESAGIRTSVFACAEDCLAALPRQPCDVVVTDFRLEGMDGLSLLQELKRRYPWLHTIIATAYGDIPLAVAATKAGAASFLQKPLDRQELMAAIRSALESAAQPVSYPREALSDVETRVLRLFLNGLTAKKTAETLNRSPRTIEAHRYRLMRKFGVHNAVQLARKAGTLWSEE